MRNETENRSSKSIELGFFGGTDLTSNYSSVNSRKRREKGTEEVSRLF